MTVLRAIVILFFVICITSLLHFPKWAAMLTFFVTLTIVVYKMPNKKIGGSDYQ